MRQDWEHFLSTVNGRYESGSAEPAAPTAKPAAPKPVRKEPTAPKVQPVRQTPAASKQKKRGNPILAVILVLVMLGGVAALVIPRLLTASDPYGGKILDGITVCGIDVSGMSKKEAVQAVQAAVSPGAQELVIRLPGSELRLNPKETGAALNASAMVDAAYALGRSEEYRPAALEAADWLTFNEDAIRNALATCAAELSDTYAPADFHLEGTVPALGEDSFRESAALPALVIRAGTPGRTLDTEALYGKILEAFAAGQFEIDAQSLVTMQTPELPDAETLLEEVCVAPVDAKLDPSTHQPIPGSYGLGYDSEKLAELLKTAEPGAEIRVELEAVAPAVMGQEVYFQDILGFCQTPHSTNEKRTTNLRLACSMLNGIVLEPGETLSYNATLGKRTEERGYLPAPAYSGTELVDSIGGGICQVSSTLYLCSLYAGLETLDRVSHGYPVAYIPMGLDATVSWGSPDLKIQNTYDYPVKLIAEEADGFVRIWIMGTETRDYYVRMGFTSSSDGYARNYLCKYDPETDQQISREAHHLSSYLEIHVPVAGEIGPGECWINGMVRPQESCTPSKEALEAAMQYSKPNQYPEG